MDAYPLAALAMLGMGAKKGAGKVKDWVKDRNEKKSSESSETGNTSPVLVNSSKGIESNTALSNPLLQEIADNTSENSSVLGKIATSMLIMKGIMKRQEETSYLQQKLSSAFRKDSSEFDKEDTKIQKMSNFISKVAGLFDARQWRMDTDAYDADKEGRAKMHKDQKKAESTREAIEESDISRNRKLKEIGDSLNKGLVPVKAESSEAIDDGTIVGHMEAGTAQVEEARPVERKLSESDKQKQFEKEYKEEQIESAALKAESDQDMRTSKKTGKDLGENDGKHLIDRNWDANAERIDFVGPAAPVLNEKGEVERTARGNAKVGSMMDGDVIRQQDRAETHERTVGFMEADDAAKEMKGMFSDRSTSDYIKEESSKLEGHDSNSEIINAIVDGKTATIDGFKYLGDFASRTWDLDKRNEKLDKKIHALEKRERYLERTQKLEAGKMGLDGKATKGFGQEKQLSNLIKFLKGKKKKGGGLFGGLIGGAKKLLGGTAKGMLGLVGALAAGKGIAGAASAFGQKSGAVDAVKNAKAKGVEKVTKIKDAIKGKVDKVKSKASSIKSAINKNEDVHGEVIRQNDRAETNERNIGFMKNDDAAKEMDGVSTSDYISKEGAKLDGAEGPSEIKNAIVDGTSEIKNAIVDGTNAVTGIMGDMLDFSSRTWDLDKRNEKLDKKIHALEKRERYLERTRKLEAGKLGADGSKTKGFGGSDQIKELIKRLKGKKKKGGGLLGGAKKLLGGAGKGILAAVTALAAGKGISSAFGAFGDKSGAVDAAKNAKTKVADKVTKIKDAVKGKVDKVKSKASSIKSTINKNKDVKSIKKGVSKKTAEVKEKIKSSEKLKSAKETVSKKTASAKETVSKKASALKGKASNWWSKKASALKGKASNWWNKGKDSKSNMKSLGGKESKTSWKKLLANDKAQITKNKVSQIGKGMKGWNPLKAFSPKMVKTGPTPAVRQAVERPISAAKKFGGNIVEKAKGIKAQGIGNVAKGGMQAAKSGIGSVARGAMTVGRAGLAAAPGALSAAGGAIASGASAAAGAAGSAMSGIGALAAANPIGAAVLATAAVGAGGYMLWDKMRGTDEAKEAFDAAEEAGLVDHDVVGDSEVLDWEGIKKLSPKALDGLIEYDDWSSEDMDKLKQIKETGELDDKIKKKKKEVKKDKRVADRVERKSRSVNGRHMMMTDEEGNTSMTKHNFSRAGIKERNAMLGTGSRQATRDEVDQLVGDTRNKAQKSAGELKSLEARKIELNLEARKIELNQSGDKLKQGQGESGVSGQTNNAPVIVSNQGGSTSNNSSVTNIHQSPQQEQKPWGMGQTDW